jgi:hypothetical protein
MDIPSLEKLVSEWYEQQESVPRNTTVTISINRLEARTALTSVRMVDLIEQVADEFAKNLVTRTLGRIEYGFNKKIRSNSRKDIGQIQMHEFLEVFPTQAQFKQLQKVGEEVVKIIEKGLKQHQQHWPIR